MVYVDSRGFFGTISTMQDGKEYRPRETVQRIRDCFESGGIDILIWLPTGHNLAYGPKMMSERSMEAEQNVQNRYDTD